MGQSRTAKVKRVNLFLITFDSFRENLDKPPGREVCTDMVVAKPGQAHSRKSHSPDGFSVVGEERSGNCAADNPTAFLEWPDRCDSAKVETEAVVPLPVRAVQWSH